jgi:hypothetical protein
LAPSGVPSRAAAGFGTRSRLGGQRGYTRAVLASQIASNLALINWTVLAGLAVGSFGVVLLARARTPATKGYLAFTAFCAAGW